MVRKCLSINSIVILIIALSLLLAGCNLENLPQGELIDSSVSPNGIYTVNAYLCSGNATTDFSVRCEVVNSKTSKCRNIYWEYHKKEVSLDWESNEIIIIDGIRLNVLTDEYDWRND